MPVYIQIYIYNKKNKLGLKGLSPEEVGKWLGISQKEKGES